MFGVDARNVFSSIGKSILKVFVSRSEKPKEKKEGRLIRVTFEHPTGGTKSFQVCLLPRTLKGPPKEIPAKVYTTTEVPKNDYGVVAIGVRLDINAPPHDRFWNSRWFCRLGTEDGLDIDATVVPIEE